MKVAKVLCEQRDLVSNKFVDLASISRANSYPYTSDAI